jgi:hypothetical protein
VGDHSGGQALHLSSTWDSRIIIERGGDAIAQASSPDEPSEDG